MSVEMGIDKIIKKRVNIEDAHDKAVEICDVSADAKGGNVAFTKNFVCLGSNVDFMLDETVDVKNRISKAVESMGALKCSYDAKKVPLITKINLYHAISMSLVLCRSENWSGNKGDLAMMEVLHP